MTYHFDVTPTVIWSDFWMSAHMIRLFYMEIDIISYNSFQFVDLLIRYNP